jgi:hypothetical protein
MFMWKKMLEYGLLDCIEHYHVKESIGYPFGGENPSFLIMFFCSDYPTSETCRNVIQWKQSLYDLYP